jgi:uncharacterized OsmC-like protein
MAMDEELLVTAVDSRTSGVPGRSLNSARGHHFVIDGSAAGGGPAEEITPGEAFLSGVSACGVLLVEARAAEVGIPLRVAEARIEGVRDAADPARYLRVDLRFRLAGVSREQAEALVAHYQGRCPLYATVAAATAVCVTIDVDED